MGKTIEHITIVRIVLLTQYASVRDSVTQRTNANLQSAPVGDEAAGMHSCGVVF